MASHWSQSAEVVKTTKPLLFLLWLLKVFPQKIVNAMAYPVSFFFFLIAKEQRNEVLRFQKQLKKWTGGNSPKKISSYKTILSFSKSIIEKAAGWLGKTDASFVEFHGEDLEEYKKNLVSGRGVVIIASHLGNMELLRSLAHLFSDNAKFSVTIIMEVESSVNFLHTMMMINPDFIANVINAENIGLETIFLLEERLSCGGIVVVTGDRTSIRTKNRVIKREFLGKTAKFPYGVFLLPFLLKAPVFFMFGVRKNTGIPVKNDVFIKKSFSKTDCERSKRQEQMNFLCAEFVSLLEDFCIQFPYQWYNFFDFWAKD